MNISYKWLKDYVDYGSLTPEELDELLTFSGLEVEGIERVDSIRGGLEHVVIGQVLSCEMHPDSDHLHLTTVDVGGERPLNIVCGAPNVAVGQKVVCAQIGTRIYTSETEFYEIKKGKLRGAVSEGMLCAADELQLGSDHAGIMVLPDDARVGMSAKEYFGVEEDYVLEVAITANRSDATSHIGVARDVVAVLNTRRGAGLKLMLPEITAPLVPSRMEGAVSVEVEREDLCPRYTGVTLRGLKVGDSPEWMQRRLRTVGIRPINAVVDVTNYVLMEVGQPMHAFDADRIVSGKVVVKCMPTGTRFVTLDGEERELDERDLMICNAEEPMCIAGVFGGQKSGVTKETTSVFLESAYFDPVSIRKTSKRHGLKTDASFRYERGCDPNITIWALERAVKLIQEICGGEVCGNMVDLYPNQIHRAMVEINFKRVADLVGKEIPVDVIRTALTSLGIEIVREEKDGMYLKIPTCKVDVYRECDVVEEIMRIYGYNNIGFGERMNSCLSYGVKPNPRRLQNVVSNYLTDNGFCEIMNNSLTKSDYYRGNVDYDEAECVRIINPLSRELDVMRQSLLYGGMESVVRNINHQCSDLKLYEFGRIYRLNRSYKTDEEGKSDVTKKYVETQRLSIFMTGAKKPESWREKQAAVDFFDLKAVVMALMGRMRMNVTRMEFRPTEKGYLSQGIDVVMRDSKKTLVSFGSLSREVLKQMGCKQEVLYADVDWSLMLKNYPDKEVTYKELAKYPEVRRDLALVLKKEVSFAEVEKVAYATEKRLLKRVSLFDVYEGKGIVEGMKSYAVSFVLQDEEKTLTDKQIEAVMAKLQANLERQLGAKIRS